MWELNVETSKGSCKHVQRHSVHQGWEKESSLDS